MWDAWFISKHNMLYKTALDVFISKWCCISGHFRGILAVLSTEWCTLLFKSLFTLWLLAPDGYLCTWDQNGNHQIRSSLYSHKQRFSPTTDVDRKFKFVSQNCSELPHRSLLLPNQVWPPSCWLMLNFHLFKLSSTVLASRSDCGVFVAFDTEQRSQGCGVDHVWLRHAHIG